MIRDLAEFRCSRFAPVLPEECQVNPGRYGAELAFWVCTRLYEENRIATSYPDHEDWGWLLSYTTESGDEFALCCGNIEGAHDRWLISIRSYGRGLFRGSKPPFERANGLMEALRHILETEESITGLDWRYLVHPA